MRLIRRQLLLVLVVLCLLTACEPLKDLGEALGDLFKRIAPSLP